ncbi:MAG: helix-hairpin-helix domain-containing protein [Candidatus Acetothermia bacterium]|jgi:competence protein ComEA|nr:helix-hairpin-helix domain-containing protein [Candidatus Acetothermia bacterium]MDH7504878.1 helix-hairpin-helix domain-containing protein [Candidatus Acetothermia bacterium]
MTLSRSDRAVLGLLLGLVLLAAGIARIVTPVPQQLEVAVEEALDLNRASFEELLRLPGIGPTLAERIIAYREAHGPFRVVEELLSVKGIGPKLLQQLAGKITVSATGSPP